MSARRSATVVRPSFWTSLFETVGRSVRRWGYEMPGGETLRVLVRLSEVFGSELVMKMSRVRFSHPAPNIRLSSRSIDHVRGFADHEEYDWQGHIPVSIRAADRCPAYFLTKFHTSGQPSIGGERPGHCGLRFDRRAIRDRVRIISSASATPATIWTFPLMAIDRPGWSIVRRT